MPAPAYRHAPRIALLGFSIECNRFAPPSTEADFRARTWLEGAEMIDEARRPVSRMLGELPGFVADMDAAGPWEPVPLFLAMTEPNGPVDHALFTRMMRRWEEGLRTAGLLDGICCVLHGAGLTTKHNDPEGALLEMVRAVAGPTIPLVATYDLHGNVSEPMVRCVDAFVAYRTNPHTDLRERGGEAAQLLRLLLGGVRTHVASCRVPIVAPTVTQLTSRDAPVRPYGELVDLGQERMAQPPYAGRVLNVSVMSGFAYGDTPFNGLTAVVTATDPEAAEALALEIGEAAWGRREQFRPILTPLEEAVRLAGATADRSRSALAFADVADNPGGGGRGNTLFILRAFHEAGVRDAAIALIHDPALAEEAHALGPGASFEARFNRGGGDAFSHPWSVPARVAALHEGAVTGRRGLFAGNTIDLGHAAAIAIGGITVCVSSVRVQCADPVFFETFGIDIARLRVAVLKSRGHFRGGFDLFFGHQQIVEVDAPGLTSPVLSRFDWRALPRPVFPLDEETHWQPERPAAVRDKSFSR